MQHGLTLNVVRTPFSIELQKLGHKLNSSSFCSKWKNFIFLFTTSGWAEWFHWKCEG